MAKSKASAGILRSSGDDESKGRTVRSTTAAAKKAKKKSPSLKSSNHATSTSSSSSSVVEQLSMLRSFVGSDGTFSETDLSTCLRQAGYNVELAAERLMTGQYQPSKKRRRSPLLSPILASPPPPMRALPSQRAPAVQPSVPPSTGSRQPTPVTPKTPQSFRMPITTLKGGRPSHSTKSAVTTIQGPAQKSKSGAAHSSPPLTTNTTTTKTTVRQSPSGKNVHNKHLSSLDDDFTELFNFDTQKDDDSWLLCHRWISDGICLQRHGSTAPREEFTVEWSTKTVATNNHSNNSNLDKVDVRFRGAHVQGQFPKHLSRILAPLLNANLVQVKVQALMEERSLPMGAHIAFAIWIYLPCPTSFFNIFPQMEQASNASVSKSIFYKLQQQPQQPKSGNDSKRKRFANRLDEAAFGLLQWAQHGEPYEFTAPPAATSPSSNHSDNGDDGSSKEDGEENAEPTLLVEEDAAAVKLESDDIPEWAQAITNNNDNNNNAPSHRLQELDAPESFGAKLRPYQRQALWWMTQREAQPSTTGKDDTEFNEQSSREQIQLLQELIQSTGGTQTTTTIYNNMDMASKETPIHCECGPVQVHLETVPAPPVGVDHNDMNGNGKSPLSHPMWERRFLTNHNRSKALCFYVQPVFGMASATPPPPPQPCRGGILADAMGLGKTVMLLALIQASADKKGKNEKKINEAINGDPNPTTTLIVAPLSLLTQWQEELASKTNLTYLIYYGDDKKSVGSQELDSVDVVLTTYGSLQGEWLAHSKLAKKGQAADPNGTTPSGLMSHTWKRVILDEAHCIKNSTTVASRACCLLRAERRWCVSGTIIQNSLDDVYALMKFLLHEPWCHHSFWKAAITQAPDSQQALDRVRRLLIPIMLRRTKQSLDTDGNPILTLPPVETKLVAVDFSPAERQFYDALHRKSLSLFEGYIQAGSASKSWLAIFSLLHRLRQSCDHVALTIRAHVDDNEWANNIMQSTNTSEAPFNGEEANKSHGNTKDDAIGHQFLDELMSKFRSMQSTLSKGNSKKKVKEERKQLIETDTSFAAKIAKMLNEAVQSKSSMLKEECPYCLDPISIQDSVVTPCFHIFCKDCLINILRGLPQKQDSTAKGSMEKDNGTILRLPSGPCPVCNESIDSNKILRLSESDGHIQTSYLINTLVSPEAVATREGDNAARLALETAVRGSASSKLNSILEELDLVWREEPGSKVLIFSQFLGFLDLIEESFKTTNIPYARLDGKLSLKQRVAVLQEFGSESAAAATSNIANEKSQVGSVLLISMKAGGVGLNLVAARTVFIADPWWNAAVEDQCVDRIHRIGQTADKVRVRKFYVTNTVEERILELQSRKKNMAREAMRDNGKAGVPTGTGSNNPTLEDFKILFGDG